MLCQPLCQQHSPSFSFGNCSLVLLFELLDQALGVLLKQFALVRREGAAGATAVARQRLTGWRRPEESREAVGSIDLGCSISAHKVHPAIDRVTATFRGAADALVVRNFHNSKEDWRGHWGTFVLRSAVFALSH